MRVIWLKKNNKDTFKIVIEYYLPRRLNSTLSKYFCSLLEYRIVDQNMYFKIIIFLVCRGSYIEYDNEFCIRCEEFSGGKENFS